MVLASKEKAMNNNLIELSDEMISRIGSIVAGAETTVWGTGSTGWCKVCTDGVCVTVPPQQQ